MLDLVFCRAGIEGFEKMLDKLTDALPDVNYIDSRVPDSIAIRIGNEGGEPDLGLVFNVTDPVDPESDTLHITFDNADAGKDYCLSATDVVTAFTNTIKDTESYKSGNIVVAFDPDSTSFELMVAVSSEAMSVLANVTRELSDRECAVIAGISKGA